jgi:hypothetical protein
MITPTVHELTRLSAHRRDVPMASATPTGSGVTAGRAGRAPIGYRARLATAPPMRAPDGQRARRGPR